MNRPKFSCVSLGDFHGHPGGKICIGMSDRFPATTIVMAVVLRNAEGGVIERGPATRSGTGGWAYTTTKPVWRTAPLTVEATATDRFAKSSRRTFTGLTGARQPLVS